MNQIVVTGLMAQDPVVRGTQSGKIMVTFDIASRRRYKDRDGNRVTDFIPCKAFGMSAEFISGNFIRGDAIEIRGELQQSRYEDSDGKTRKAHTICVDEASFAPRNPDGRVPREGGMVEEMREQAMAKSGFREVQNSFQDMTPVEDEELPF